MKTLMREPMTKGKGPHLCGPSLVELPGIELGGEIALTCGSAGFDDAKQRERTGNDLRIHRKMLTASTRRSRPQV
jgi:hypothetical protein